MLRRSKSERFSRSSGASPGSPDFEGHFRSISHPIKDFERTSELDQDTTHPIFDNFTQQNSLNGYPVREDIRSIKDRRILCKNKNKNETISVDLPPVRGRSTLFSTNQSNSGAAPLNIPPYKLTSSKSLSSLKTKDYFYAPEVIKPIPSSCYTENIGIALGSPSHCDDFEMKVPLVSDGNSGCYINNCNRQPSPKNLKSKVSSKWKTFEGLFRGKSKETVPITAYHRYYGRPRPTLESNSSKKALNVGKNRRKSVTYTKKPAMRPASRATNFSSRFNSPSSKVDGQVLKKKLGAGKYDTLIDVDIPFTEMDRYSVILDEVSQRPPFIGQPPLYRRQTVLGKFKSVHGDFTTNEQDIQKTPEHMKKPSKSSSLKIANFPSLRDKSPSRTGSPIQQTAAPHLTQSKKSSKRLLSITKSHSIDYRTNDKRRNGKLTKNSNNHPRSYSDTTRINHKALIPPSVPKKKTQGPILSAPEESLLDFGFSKTFIKDGYQDSFTSTPPTKQFDSSISRPQQMKYSEMPPSLSSISSSDRSLSRSTSSSSVASPLGTTPLTGNFDEMRFPTPPIGTAVYTSFMPPSLSAPTHRTKSSLSNYSTKKSSTHPPKTNILKKSTSFSEKLGRTKSCLKITSYSQNKESKSNHVSKPTPSPSVTASNPAKLANYTTSSPLDAFANAINKEIGRETPKLSRGRNPQKELGCGIHTKKYEFKEQVSLGAKSRNPSFTMFEQGKPRGISKSLDLTRKDNENYVRGTDSISNIPTWNSNKSPVVGLTAVSVARGIIAREYRKSHKAAVEGMDVAGSF